MFINRKRELSALKERLKSLKAEFVIIYGRRRVGKSELITKFIEGTNGLRLLGREESEAVQLRRFSEIIGEYFNDDIVRKNPFSNWDSLFTYITEKAKNRFILAIDEFPYLVQENRSLPSILQDYWDNRLKNTKLFLILCGSSIGMMEELLGGRSPIYGRRTAQILIKPFTFRDVYGWLNNNIEKAIQAFSIFGGTPAYILEYDKKKGIWENIKEKILRQDAFLYRDTEFILREELKEPRFYFSILSAIAKGKTKSSEIINDTGLDKGIVGKYLSVLSELQLIERVVPVTERHPEKSRKGIYRLPDNYFKFWFRYVYPYIEYVESGAEEHLLNKVIKPTLNQFMGLSFEDISRELLMEMPRQGRLPFHFSKIGKWWHKDKEIDIVALNEDTKDILFCEVKWQNNVNGVGILKNLKENAKLIDWFPEDRKEHYCIIAKSFKRKAEGAINIELEDFRRILR